MPKAPFYEATAWPLTSNTHCYTISSSEDGSSSASWATQFHVCRIDNDQLSCRPVPLRNKREYCVGYTVGCQWEAFSFMKIDKKEQQQTVGGQKLETLPPRKDMQVQAEDKNTGRSAAPGPTSATPTTVSRSHSLIALPQELPQHHSSSGDFSSSSLPTDVLMVTDPSEDVEVKGPISIPEHSIGCPPSSLSSSRKEDRMTLVVQRMTADAEIDSQPLSFSVSLHVRPTALCIVEANDDKTSSPFRLWWGCADNSLLRRMEGSLLPENNNSNDGCLTTTLKVSMESPVLALEGSKDIIAVACQDGSVLIMSERDGTVTRKIIIDGPIVALQVQTSLQPTTSSSILVGSLCGYVARVLVGDEPPTLVLQGLQEGGAEDSVLTVFERSDTGLCWAGTRSGRCIAVKDGKIQWGCQFPHPVHSISEYKDGVLVITGRSAHWLRPVDGAVKRARDRLEALKVVRTKQ